MRAVRFDRFGGPEVLTVVEVPTPVPKSGETLLRVEAAGINFAETHQVDGSYLDAGALPYIPGSEVVGRTPTGRRVLARVSQGYAEYAVAKDSALVDVPEGLAPASALALLMQGLTAWHLLRTAARLRAGESVLVHAAAGGVGSLAVQLAKEFGAGRVLAQAFTPDKEALALELGADAVARYPLDERPDVILDATGGELFASAGSSRTAMPRAARSRVSIRWRSADATPR
ncbi:MULTISPECIES: zinc-binding dehydrogenase [unclassified Streptomyces]|uniref:quinone oxidoreductase family protein n=1 Tax=unclassified Streptomyces TaxID=2593676 RepID=UPI00278C0838|nr:MULTISPECIES: zinc-binding dehydrogenase [unclassified Streptomyces]